MTERFTLSDQDKADMQFDDENDVLPARTVAEQIGERFGADARHPLVDAISHAIEDALEIGERRQKARLLSTLNQLRREHFECEDCWYSCPKSEGGCCNSEQGKDCNCGADQHNAIIDAAIQTKSPTVSE
jgi:hypothetical protein